MFKQIVFLLGQDWKQLPPLFLANVILAIMELFSLGLLIPLLGGELLGGIDIFQAPSSEASMISQMVDYVSNYQFHFLVMLVVISYFLKGIIHCLIQWYNYEITGKIEERLKNQLVKKALNLPPKLFINSSTAALNYAATVQASLFSNSVIFQSLRAISNTSVTIGLLIFLISLNPKMVLIAFALLAFVGVAYFRLSKKYLVRWGAKMNASQVSVASVVEDLLNGLKQIKVNDYTDIVTNVSKNSIREYRKSMVKVSIIQQATQPIFEFSAICMIALFVVLNYYGTIKIEPFQVVLFIICLMKILPAVNSINQCIMKIKYNKDTINTLYNMLSQKLNYLDLDLERNTNYIVKNEMDQDIGTLKLEGVVINTPDGIKLNSPISFTAKKGDIILLRGESGIGKTSVLDAICGMIKTCEGTISFSGCDPVMNLHYETQNAFFFDGNIAENISMNFGLFNFDEASIVDNIIKAHLQNSRAEAAQFAKKRINKRSGGLSGGQFQRVAFARALMADKQIVILDEFTSAMDISTEKKILSTLKSWGKNKIIICVSHSPNVAAFATQVIDVKAYSE